MASERTLAAGQRVVAMDRKDIWYPATVKRVNLSRKVALVHFIGWGDKYNVWEPFDSKRVRLPESFEQANRDNEDECYLCGEVGDLLCCDGCSVSVHLHCAQVHRLPADDKPWYCGATRDCFDPFDLVKTPGPLFGRRRLELCSEETLKALNGRAKQAAAAAAAATSGSHQSSVSSSPSSSKRGKRPRDEATPLNEGAAMSPLARRRLDLADSPARTPGQQTTSIANPETPPAQETRITSELLRAPRKKGRAEAQEEAAEGMSPEACRDETTRILATNIRRLFANLSPTQGQSAGAAATATDTTETTAAATPAAISSSEAAAAPASPATPATPVGNEVVDEVRPDESAQRPLHIDRKTPVAHMLGLKVTKFFPGHGYFHGEVSHVNPRQKRLVVTYEDGDSENYPRVKFIAMYNDSMAKAREEAGKAAVGLTTPRRGPSAPAAAASSAPAPAPALAPAPAPAPALAPAPAPALSADKGKGRRRAATRRGSPARARASNGAAPYTPQRRVPRHKAPASRVASPASPRTPVAADKPGQAGDWEGKYTTLHKEHSRVQAELKAAQARISALERSLLTARDLSALMNQAVSSV